MYYVIEGEHEDPNDIKTIIEVKEHGPYDKQKADELAMSLIRMNMDNYYHRAWVISELMYKLNKVESNLESKRQWKKNKSKS